MQLFVSSHHNVGIDEYRSEIDGLRAIAVIAVILNHFDSNLLPGGYLGVDIFFVISGYVITSSFARRNENAGLKNFLTNFYSRRVKRLLPALIFLVLSISIIICFFNPKPLISLRTGMTSLAGVSNLYLFHRSTEYFSELTNYNPFIHTWSLGVEEQFYFLFPFIIWISGYPKRKNKAFKNLLFLTIPLTIISLIGFIYLYPTNQPAAYFLMPTRFWEMASGSLVFLLIKRESIIFKKLYSFPDYIALIFILLTFFVDKSFGMYSTILMVILTSILIVCIKKNSIVFLLLTKKTFSYLGKISYSLYLWHWPILTISRWTIGIYWWTVPIQISIILVFALVSYKYIEEPFRKINYQQNQNIIYTSLVSILISISSILTLNNFFKYKIYTGNKQNWIRATNWRNDISSINHLINGKKCHGSISYSENEINNIFESCSIKNKSSKNTVAFVGDSHALSLISSQEIIYDMGLNVFHYSFDGCPFPKPKYGVKPKQCSDFLDKLEEQVLTKLNENDTLIILNYHLAHLGDKTLIDVRHNIYDKKGNLPKNGLIKTSIYIETLKNFIQELRSKKINTLLIGAGARNKLIHVEEKEWFRPQTKNNFKNEMKNATKLNNYISSQLTDIKGLTFFDPIKEMPECCYEIKSYKKYFRDGNHYSDYGAEILIKKLIPYINKNYPAIDNINKI